MKFCLGILGLVALLALGCSARPAPKSIALASFYQVDYRNWSCEQLADEAESLSDALAVSTEHDPNAHATDRVLHITRARQAVRSAAATKGCKT
jgi:hypothetical protein